MQNRQKEFKLFGMFPIFNCEYVGSCRIWRFLHLPVFKAQYLSKGLVTTYYVLNVPVLQKVRRFL